MHKKEFTSFDVAAVVNELKATVLGSRVNNVYQPDTKTLLFKLHKTDKPAFRLVAEAGRRLHLTSYTLEKSSVPPAFCMALRKYLRNAWLSDIEQYEFERIVIMTFKTQTGLLRLVLEFFGEGNAILVSDHDKIQQAMIYKRMRDRNIISGEDFKFAPSSSKNPLKATEQELSEAVKTSGDVDVVRAIARFLSIGGFYTEEVLLKAGVDKTRACNALNGEEIKAVFCSLQDLLANVKDNKLEPCIVLDQAGSFTDVVPFKLKRYEDSKLQQYDSFNEALDEFYVRILSVEQATAGVEIGKLKREAERLNRIIADQKKVLTDAESEAEQGRRIGDVIYAHFADLQILLGKFMSDEESGKDRKTSVSEIVTQKEAGLKPWTLVESFDSNNLFVNVCLEGTVFGLDLRKTLYENAARFYERGKKAKQKNEGAKAALNDSNKKLEEIEAKLQRAEALEKNKPAELEEELAERKLKHKEWFEKFRWFVSSDDFLVVAGKDAVTNEVLVKKYTDDDDVVFHADIVGAPFVVIKTKNKTPTIESLNEAAQFAAAFSRGWREGFGSIDVYSVKPEQLSKGGPSGESVGHGAFVVRGERNWFRGTALRLAIGVIAEADDTIRFVGGPVNSVKCKTQAYVTITPGDTSGKDLLKHVLSALARKMPKEKREKILKASVEEIREFIPFNKGRLAEV